MEVSNGFFSKHGNLKQTIIQLIRQSPTRLNAVEIAKTVDLLPGSSFFTQIKNVGGIKREKLIVDDSQMVSRLLEGIDKGRIKTSFF